MGCSKDNRVSGRVAAGGQGPKGRSHPKFHKLKANTSLLSGQNKVRNTGIFLVSKS